MQTYEDYLKKQREENAKQLAEQSAKSAATEANAAASAFASGVKAGTSMTTGGSANPDMEYKPITVEAQPIAGPEKGHYNADAEVYDDLNAAAAEKAHAELEAMTVDKIFCGEQQSESDHFMASDASWNGSDGGVHWRRARGSFSYQLKTADAKKVVLKGFAWDRQQISVAVNGTVLGTFNLNRDGQIEVALPSMSSDVMTLTLTPAPGQETPRISEIRMMK